MPAVDGGFEGKFHSSTQVHITLDLAGKIEKHLAQLPGRRFTAAAASEKLHATARDQRSTNCCAMNCFDGK